MFHILHVENQAITESFSRVPIPLVWSDGSSVPGLAKVGRTSADGLEMLVEGTPGDPKGSGSMIRETGINTVDGFSVIEGRERYDPPPPPPPNPENYRSDRKREIANTIGGGSFEDALGEQQDENLRLLDALALAKPDFDAANGVAALKAALAPLFNLTPDADTIITEWKAAKAKFPKP